MYTSNLLYKNLHECFSVYLQAWDMPQSGHIKNTGHSIQFVPSSSNSVTLQTHTGAYSFAQFHFHWGTSSQEGSEHTINGKPFSAELHFVHCKTNGPKDARDYLSVLGVLCEAENVSISNTVWEKLVIPHKFDQSHPTTNIVFSQLLPSNREYYHYEGSLTTPPCSEVVMWYVFKQPIKIPEDFLTQLRCIEDENNQPITHNYRFPKPLNGRIVEAEI